MVSFMNKKNRPTGRNVENKQFKVKIGSKKTKSKRKSFFKNNKNKKGRNNNKQKGLKDKFFTESSTTGKTRFPFPNHKLRRDGTEIRIVFPNTLKNMKSTLKKIIDKAPTVYQPSDMFIRFDSPEKCSSASSALKEVKLDNSESLDIRVVPFTPINPLEKLLRLPHDAEIDVDELKRICNATAVKVTFVHKKRVFFLHFKTEEDALKAQHGNLKYGKFDLFLRNTNVQERAGRMIQVAKRSLPKPKQDSEEDDEDDDMETEDN